MKRWINGEEQGELTDDTAEAYAAGQVRCLGIGDSREF